MQPDARGRGGRLRRVAALLCVALLPALLPVRAQETPAPTPKKPAIRDEFDRGTPRSSVVGYLLATRSGDYQRAARYLNLRSVPKKERAERGPVLARHLKVVLDRTLWVDVDALSDDPRGERDDGLPATRDRVGTIKTSKGEVEVLVGRVRRSDGTPIWKISYLTVRQIPDLYAEFGYGVLGEYLPPVAFEVQFLEIALWQWVGLLVLLFVSVLASWLLVSVIVRGLGPLVRRSRTELDDQLLRLLTGPARLVTTVGLFYTGTLLLRLSVVVQQTLHGLMRVTVIGAIAWLLIRSTDVFAQILQRRLLMRRDVAGTALLPLGRKTLKALLTVAGTLAVLQNLGFNVTGIIAGLGIGGLAVALAAQKTVENLFGAVTLTIDQPVRIGDFCRYGDRVGTVEDIGLRSTRIRSLDRTVVSVPNAEFANMELENFSRRDRIWFHPSIGLRYETSAEQLRYVLVELKKLLLSHPKVDPDPARVRFVGFGDSSLNLDIFAYIRTRDYNEFLAIREDLFLRIIEIVEAAGSGFAFPSHTAYLATDEAPDPERRRKAEERVRELRKAGRLPLPEFPTEDAARLRATIEYPPSGSSRREQI